MANLAISAVCNRQCAYCFTRDYLDGTRRAPDFVSLPEFERWLDFLDRSGVQAARLLGGEPTLHPAFVEIVARARAHGKTIIVFSNGLMPETALDCLARLPPEACTVLVNVNPPVTAGQREAFQRLGLRAMAGLNIDRPDIDPAFLLPLIAEAGCRRAVRLGLAQPCLSGRNRHVRPKQYRILGAQIAGFSRAAQSAGVRVEFDCGFVPCMFSAPELDGLRAAGAGLGWHCNPILDVTTAGEVLHCYPLAQLGSLPLTADSRAAGLRSAFESRVRAFRQAGVFPDCPACAWHASGECPGGCLSATLRRFRPAPYELRVPAAEGAR